jgi:multidrug efflux pump subunit AcrA (membrane-fusion protein)
MKKKVKLILIIAASVLVVAYLAYDYLQPMPVETQTLEAQDGAITFTETGVVVNKGEVSLYPMVSGEVKSIKVENGDTVKEGQVLAELDSAMVEFQREQLLKTIDAYTAQMNNVDVEYANTVDTMKANRSNLYSQLDALEAQASSEEQVSIQQSIVDQAKASWERSVEDLDKYQVLYDEGIISESELNELKTLATNYESAYNQSLMQLDSMESGSSNGDYLEAMKNSIYAQINGINRSLARDNTAESKAYFKAMIEVTRSQADALEKQIDYYTLKSPIAGVVDEINIENSNLATS